MRWPLVGLLGWAWQFSPPPDCRIGHISLTHTVLFRDTTAVFFQGFVEEIVPETTPIPTWPDVLMCTMPPDSA